MVDVFPFQIDFKFQMGKGRRYEHSELFTSGLPALNGKFSGWWRKGGKNLSFASRITTRGVAAPEPCACHRSVNPAATNAGHQTSAVQWADPGPHSNLITALEERDAIMSTVSVRTSGFPEAPAWHHWPRHGHGPPTLLHPQSRSLSTHTCPPWTLGLKSQQVALLSPTQSSVAVTLWINTHPILSQNLCQITFWFWRLRPEMEKSRFHCQKSFNWGARQGWKAERSRGNDSETAELLQHKNLSGAAQRYIFFNEAVPREWKIAYEQRALAQGAVELTRQTEELLGGQFAQKQQRKLRAHFFFYFNPLFFFNFLFSMGIQPVSSEHRRDSVIHLHIAMLPQTSLPSRIPCNIEQSSTGYRAGPCWLSILNLAVCTCPSQMP